MANDKKGKTSPNTKDCVRVRSMSYAAYYKMRGLKVLGAQRLNSRSGEYEFIVHDPDKRIEQLRLDFLESEANDFDNAVRSIRAFLNS